MIKLIFGIQFGISLRILEFWTLTDVALSGEMHHPWPPPPSPSWSINGYRRIAAITSQSAWKRCGSGGVAYNSLVTNRYYSWKIKSEKSLRDSWTLTIPSSLCSEPDRRKGKAEPSRHRSFKLLLLSTSSFHKHPAQDVWLTHMERFYHLWRGAKGDFDDRHVTRVVAASTEKP